MTPSTQRTAFPAARSLTAALLTTLLAAANPARASLLAYEGFDYAAGASLTGKTGPTGFSAAYTAAASGTLVSAGGYA